LFVEILDGVNYLLSRSPPVIHRDFEVSKYFVEKRKTRNCFRIADFGLFAIYKFVEESDTDYKRTVAYMALEVIDGTKYDVKVSNRSN
jgi:serine/threonine protein kinase